MATWPDIGEVRTYVGEVNDDQMPVLENCLAAAVGYIGWRCDDRIEEDDEYVDIVPPALREATLQLTSRLFRRRLSPEGVSSFGEFGAVRVSRVDPDIERLLTPYRSWGI
ncbi:MAG TPA: head-tail connector protein, partial [Ilumatobacteraceae bacterium]